MNIILIHRWKINMLMTTKHNIDITYLCECIVYIRRPCRRILCTKSGMGKHNYYICSLLLKRSHLFLCILNYILCGKLIFESLSSCRETWHCLTYDADFYIQHSAIRICKLFFNYFILNTKCSLSIYA